MKTRQVSFILGLFLVLSAILNLNAREIYHQLPLQDMVMQLPERGIESPCFWYGYCDERYLYWQVPIENTNIAAISQRFPVDDQRLLMTVRFPIYDQGRNTFGNNDIYITIHDDDGFGKPGAILVADTLVAGTYQAYPIWTLVDFTPHNLIITDDFHISFSTNGDSNDGECIFSDNGSSGVGGSCFYIGGNWYTSMELFETDNFSLLIEAYMCPDGTLYNNYDTVQVESFFDMITGSTPPLPDQLPDEIIDFTGQLVFGWNDPFYNPASEQNEIHMEIIEINLTGNSPSLGTAELILSPDLPSSIGMATSIAPDHDFPAESFFDIYYEIEFPDVSQKIIPDLIDNTAPHITSEIPIDSIPQYGVDYRDDYYTPYVDREDISTIIGWLKPHLTMEPKICYCTGDVNGDGLPLGILDLTYLKMFITFGGPPPIPLYQGDLNGDEIIDLLDFDLFRCYLMNGYSCFDQYPVPTICDPDTIRGACCSVAPDSCRILAPVNCESITGTYLGDNISCDNDPCAIDCNCYPGDPSGPPLNILDATFIISYLYKNGPSAYPYSICMCDADCNCSVNILDITAIIKYLYKGGDPPCDCETWVNTCGLPLRK